MSCHSGQQVRTIRVEVLVRRHRVRVVHKQAACTPARVFRTTTVFCAMSRANSSLHGAIVEPTTPPVGTAVNRRLAFNSSSELSEVLPSQVQSLPPHLLKNEGWYIHFFTLDSSTKRLSCRICTQTCHPSLQRPSRTFAKDSRHSMRNHIVSVHPEHDGLFDSGRSKSSRFAKNISQ